MSGWDREVRPDVDLSVVIPTYGRATLLPEVLGAWRAVAPADVRTEVVVVDDGSPDATPRVLDDLACAWGDGAVALRAVRQPNRGLAAARNHGVAEARGRLLLFSDDDMVPRSTDFVRRHLRAQSAAPGAWVSRLIVSDACVATPFQAYWRRRLHGGTERLREGHDLGKGGFWFATLSIPARLLDGEPFAGAFGDYGWEEHELGYRLHRRGVRSRFLRSAEIEHHDRVDFAATRDKFRRMGRSAWTFAALHPGLEVAIWTGTHRLSRALRALARQEARAARLLARRDPATLSDAEFGACLEAAYAQGLHEGAETGNGGARDVRGSWSGPSRRENDERHGG